MNESNGSWRDYLLYIILGPLFVGIILIYHKRILHTIKKTWKSFIRKIRSKTRKYKAQKLLEEIKQPFSKINQWHRYDYEIEEIESAFYEIEEKARKIKGKKYREIKEELMCYSKKVNKIHENMSYEEKLELFARDGVKLVEEIENIKERDKS